MDLRLIKQLCKYDKDQLKIQIIKFLFDHGYKHIYKDKEGKCIFAEGTLPICLIAHMDTVFKAPPLEEDFLYDSRKKVLWAPGGSGYDDRAGIYAIMQIIKSGFMPSVIFTDEEECGGIGAKSLINKLSKCPFQKCKCLIQLDRANHNDSVFYDCANDDFEQFINKYGFKTTIGTFSDISIIAPAWKIAAVNLSIGYLDEHTDNERLVCSWCDETIEKVKKILLDIVNEEIQTYEYIPFKYSYFLDDTCLICNKPIKEKKYMINGSASLPYYLCEECYNQYYNTTNIIDNN